MSGRDEILRRVRAALYDVPSGEQPEPAAIERTYLRHDTAKREEVVARFVERVGEYRATVRRVAGADLPAAITDALQRRGVRRLVVPADLPESWIPSDVDAIHDSGLSGDDLDRCDGVLTGCALGIAQTGTIVLDTGPRQGRRAITLVPDYHLCVVQAEQIVGIVPEAIDQLAGAARHGRPITFISGPSATSDIELDRVEGVHGPRTLDVLVVDEPLSDGAARESPRP